MIRQIQFNIFFCDQTVTNENFELLYPDEVFVENLANGLGDLVRSAFRMRGEAPL